MALIKTELRHQNGVASELIEVVEQLNGSRVKHYKHVEIALRVLQTHFARSVVTEVVASRTERIPHHSVATGAPVERCGRRYATVNPAVGVLDGNALATMRETTVLHSTSIKVLAVVRTHRHRSTSLVYFGWCEVLYNGLSGAQVDNVHVAGVLVDVDTHGGCGYLQGSVYVNGADVYRHATCEFGEYLCRWCSHRVVYYPTLIIAKHSYYVVAIEVESHLSAVGVVDLDGVRIDLCHVLDRKRLIRLFGRLFNHKSGTQWNGVNALRHERQSCQSERHCQSNRSLSRLPKFIVCMHIVVLVMSDFIFIDV